MIYRSIIRFTFYFGLVLCFQISVAAETCSPDCDNLREQRDKLEKNVHRLMGIKATNQEFLLKLDSSQDSLRIKANSNIRIAEKRISEAEEKIRNFENIKKEKKCLTCEKS